MIRVFIIALHVFGLSIVAVLAQTSPSYRVDEWTVHAGGHPLGGFGLASTSYRMSLDAVGEIPIAPLLHSTGYSIDVGFARSYPPPLEVREVVALGDKATFAWAPDRSVGSYRVYRGLLRELPGSYGACRIADISADHVMLEETPNVGQTFFYLVTAQNTLLEEGPTGYDSAGASRVVSGPCP
jgi:hypothetical protein